MWPDVIQAGSISNFPTAFPDFFPTFMEVAEIEESFETDGISLLPVMTGTCFIYLFFFTNTHI